MSWTPPTIAVPSAAHRERALLRQQQLTKPPGALGTLEALAVRLAAMQRSDSPAVDRASITLFAADHGIAEEGVSAFPQAVTRLMLRNFLQGGAAISVLARHLEARLEVVDVGVADALEDHPDLVLARVGPGTANFCRGPAMETGQMAQALTAGAEAARRAARQGAQLFIVGEMGIANTTSATALASALLGLEPTVLVGPGTGLDRVGVGHKLKVVEAALRLHENGLNDPWEILRRLGGFEIAAMVGASLEAAALGIPLLVDGFICSVAALFAVRLREHCAEWLIFSHRSFEPGHGLVLEALGAKPLLDLSMRLGEGSGAAVALPLLRAACALHNGMATFAEAGIGVDHD